MIISIEGLDYELKDVSYEDSFLIDTCVHEMENPFGMDGIEALMRKNPHGDPCGYIGLIMIEVESDRLRIHSLDKEHFEHHIEDVIREIYLAYPSIGWECLDVD